MKTIRLLAIISTVLILPRILMATPCAIEDNECLLRLTLQQTLELEAERTKNSHLQRSNDLLRDRIKEEENRSDHGGRVFVLGMFTGVVFVGLLSTIALKVVK